MQSTKNLIFTSTIHSSSVLHGLGKNTESIMQRPLCFIQNLLCCSTQNYGASFT